MSLYAIKEYRNEVEKIIHYGGTKKIVIVIPEKSVETINIINQMPRS